MQPATSTAKALEKEGITAADLDLVEFNEAFAAVGMASAEQLGIPVNIHQGTSFVRPGPLKYANPILLEDIAIACPDLRIIIAHMGHPWETECVVLIRKHPNLYANISALHYRPWRHWQAFITAIEYGVEHKLIFGSDFPSATPEQVSSLTDTINEVNPTATIVRANSHVTVDDPDAIAGKRVLVVEDGPTLTHGEMKFGAGVVAAREHGATEIVDPRPWAIGTIDETFRKYDVGPVLPAEGYSTGQLAELEQAIAATPCDAIVIGTPMDLRHVVRLTRPAARVTYELQELEGSSLRDALRGVISRARPVAVG